MIGNTFVYNGKSSCPYELRFLVIDTEENKEIGGTIEYTTFKNNKSPRETIQNISYTTPFEFEVEVISDTRIDKYINEIYDWLLNQPNYSKLYIDDTDGNNGYYYNCVFTNASYINGGSQDGWGIYGIKATMKCDSAFMWKDIERKYTATQLANVVSHYNESSVREYTYPTLLIKIGGSGGDITVQNVTDNNRLTKFTNTLANDTITLSHFPSIASSELNKNDVITYEAFNKNFFRLVQGVNKIGIEGDISEITLRYKVGRLVR